MKKKKTQKSKNIYFYKKYSYELQIVVFLFLGVFLILEKYDIKSSILTIGHNIFIFFRNFIFSLIYPLYKSLINIEVSDIIGYSFILYALTLIYNRFRNKFIDSNLMKSKCSSCDSKLQRIHKFNFHKIIEKILFIKLKHFNCPQCKKNTFFVS